MNYDPNLYIEMAIQLLEGDINFIACRYFITGYEIDDLKQELRIQLFRKLPKYNPHMAGFRAWANIVMRNRMRDLLKADQRKKRIGNSHPEEFNNENHYIEIDLDGLIDLCDEKGLGIEDFL